MGTAICSVCGGFAEHDLPTKCPNRPLLAVEAVNIMDGKLNCLDDGFVWAPDVTESTMSQVVYH